LQAVASLHGEAADAVVMLGTGMPSLRAILASPRVGGAPVFSCTLALAWRCALAAEGADGSAASLLEWIGGAHWKRRLQERLESNRN
jgi:hypothetical protein